MDDVWGGGGRDATTVVFEGFGTDLGHGSSIHRRV